MANVQNGIETLRRVHERYRQTDGRTMTYSERERGLRSLKTEVGARVFSLEWKQEYRTETNAMRRMVSFCDRLLFFGNVTWRMSIYKSVACPLALVSNTDRVSLFSIEIPESCCRCGRLKMYY